ncbi:MAG TPA: tRNA lysidine(34) synthetase TilS [Fimbriiglobus sp.]|nr:tRNA lysidine(34) synthetase TilS [Fimbriiglobus sp.]
MSRVVEAIRAFPGLSGPGVVAVSGGADSVALLRGLLDAGTGPLTVAHFNHHLRGAESDADTEFVRELAAKLGLPFQLGEADVRSAAAGDNLEATARRLRYDWLAGLGGEWVATGHTADDQAETVLHRIIRGTGIQGLRGIATERLLLPSPLGGEGRGVRGVFLPPPLGGRVGVGGESITITTTHPLSPQPTPHPNPPPQGGREQEDLSPPRGEGVIRLVRPLLNITRAEVLAYLAERGQPFREDSSNTDLMFTRNRIRHELLPLLKSFNPAIVDVLSRLADQAQAAHQVIAEEATRLLTEAIRPRAGNLYVLDAEMIAVQHDYLAREVFRTVWAAQGWPMDSMTADHWQRLVGVARGDPSSADFPGGVSARRVGRVVQLGRRS